MFYPLTITKAVEDENGKALDLILADVMGSMSDAFSEAASYEVGDYCIYQDVLYKFIAAKSAGAWDVNAVSKTTIDAELKSLSNQINTLNSGVIHNVTGWSMQFMSDSTHIDIHFVGLEGQGQYKLTLSFADGVSFGPA